MVISGKGLSVRLTLTVFALFSIMLVFKPNVQAAAQSIPPAAVYQCYSLDIIFIVDQSESMSIEINPSDPMEQRKYAIEASIDQLVDNALDMCPKAIHRIGIISFGTGPVVDLQMGVINPETSIEAKVISQRLKTDVKAVDLNYTDPILAFKVAREMFTDTFTTSTVSAGAGLRKKVIIFITDGVPEREKPQDPIGPMRELGTYIEENFPFDPTIIKQNNCLDILRDRYEDLSKAPEADVMDCLSEYPVNQSQLDTSTYIFGLFFPSNAAYQSIINIWKHIVDTHEGEMFFLSNNRQEVSSTVRDIISSLIGVKLNVVRCGSFAVNPYLKRAIFTFFKIDPQLKVTLSYQDAEGVVHSINSGQAASSGGFDVGPGDYTVDGSNERYVISHPYPGIWQLTADNCNGLDVYYDPVIIQPGSYQPNLPIEIPQYELQPYYDEYNPIYLEYKVQDIEGVTLTQADDPALEINIDLSIIDPLGQPKPYSMVWDSDRTLFRTSEPLQLSLVGDYTINMVGTYMRHPGPVTVETTNMNEVFTERTTLFEQKGITFKTHAVTPFLMTLEKPKQGARVGTVHQTIFHGWPLKINPVDVTVSFHNLDQDETPLDVSEILVDPVSPLTVIITEGDTSNTSSSTATPSAVSAASGIKTSQPAYLTTDTSNTGIYHGQVINFDAEGLQTIIVSLTSKFDEYHRPQDQVLTTTFSRRDNLFTTAGTYYVILALLYLYLLIRLLVWNYGRNHQLSGYVLAKENGTVLRVLKLSNGSNRNSFDTSFWEKQKGKSLGLRRLLVTSVTTVGKSGKPVPKSKKPVPPVPVTPSDGLSVRSKAVIKVDWRTAARGGSLTLGDMDERPYETTDKEIRSLQYIASMQNAVEYAPSAEPSGRKLTLIPRLLLTGVILCAAVLTFVMIF